MELQYAYQLRCVTYIQTCRHPTCNILTCESKSACRRGLMFMSKTIYLFMYLCVLSVYISMCVSIWMSQIIGAIGEAFFHRHSTLSLALSAAALWFRFPVIGGSLVAVYIASFSQLPLMIFLVASWSGRCRVLIEIASNNAKWVSEWMPRWFRVAALQSKSQSLSITLSATHCLSQPVSQSASQLVSRLSINRFEVK